ncbi:hypothetical protein Ddc_12436 [Ditylenchus destructor]|nr:hypothetical protein Ddc_12436 [Ditylenchus destructor]
MALYLKGIKRHKVWIIERFSYGKKFVLATFVPIIESANYSVCRLSRIDYNSIAMDLRPSPHFVPAAGGSIWTTGEWEMDNRGRLYQRGILRGGHCHDAYEQFFNEDDTAFVGGGGSTDDKKSLNEDDVVMSED